jgi:hypothetical protein
MSEKLLRRPPSSPVALPFLWLNLTLRRVLPIFEDFRACRRKSSGSFDPLSCFAIQGSTMW